MRKKIRIGKAWRRIFAMMLAMALLSTAVPVDVRGDNQEEEDILALSGNDLLEVEGAFDDEAGDELWEDAYTADVVNMTANANDIGAIALPVDVADTTAAEGADKPMVIAAGAGLLDNGTGVTTDDIIFSVKWKDGSKWITWKDYLEGKYNGVDIEFPADADIHMEFKFKFSRQQGELKPGVVYRYDIPESISVDLDESDREIELTDQKGQKVGTAYVKDGYIEFVFVDDITRNEYSDIDFNVWFEGNLSGKDIDGGGDLELEFPVSGGNWDLDVTITEPAEGDKIVDTGKGGWYSEAGGYIEWTVTLNPNDAITKNKDENNTYLSGVIIDKLPPGLTYVDGSLTISNGTISGLPGDRIEYDPVSGELRITITKDDKLAEVNSWDGIKFTFRTTVDKDKYDGTITNNAMKFVNSVKYEPEENDVKSPKNPQSSVDVRTDILSKTDGGVQEGNKITWTVTINAEKMDIGGTTYTDIFDGGWAKNFDIEVIKNQVAKWPGVIVSTTDNGFSIEFPEGFKDTVVLTYTTDIADDYPGKSYTNKGELADPDKKDFNVNVSDTVTGKDWIKKSYVDYNPVTQVFYWDITVYAGDGLTDVDIVENYHEIFPDWEVGNSPQVFKFIRAYYLKNNNEMGDMIPVANSSVSEDWVKFHFDALSGTVTIRVELELTEAWLNWVKDNGLENSRWWNFTNHADLHAKKDGEDISDSADATKGGMQVKQDTKLIEKNGQSMGNGIIKWTIKVYNYDLKIEDMVIEDHLPDGLVYVEDSMYVKPAGQAAINVPESEYYHPQGVWDEAGKNLRYVIYEGGFFKGNFKETWITDNYNSWEPYFEIVYLTKPTSYQGAERGSYTNDADIDVTYDGGIEKKGHAQDTVTEPAGGVLDKEGAAQEQGRKILWTVTINEGHFDMGENLTKIYDKLKPCYRYESGTLYRISPKGERTEMKPGDLEKGGYVISVINNEIVVQLPAIGEDTIIFEFLTTITVSPEELAEKYTPITNEIDFVGLGDTKHVESGRLDDVKFGTAGGSSSTNEGIKIVKVDETGTIPLKGAVFNLYLDGDDSMYWTITTDENGIAWFNMDLNMFEGRTLTLVEQKAPQGFERENAIFPDGYEGDNSYSINIFVDQKVLSSRILEIPVINKTEEEIEKTGMISLRKVDAENTVRVLAGAKFGLYTDSDCKIPADISRTTNAQGIVEFTDLQPGTYYLKELDSPTGYVLPQNLVIKAVIGLRDEQIEVSYTVYSGDNTLVEINGDEIVVSNKKPKGSVVITKQDTAGNLLPGALFGLYEDEACTIEVDTATTDAYGKVTFTGLDYGKTYWYKEITPPDNYIGDGKAYPVTVSNGTNKIDGESVTVDPVINRKKEGNIIIYKNDENGRGLAGVTFELWYYDANNTLTPYPNPSTGETPWTVTTTKTGSIATARFTNLPYGRYQIKETGAPDGYDFDVTRNVTINTTGDTPIDINNELVTANVVISKYGAVKDGVENPLGNVSFQLVNIDTGAKWPTIGTTGSSNGQYTFKDVPYGNYHIVELDDIPPQHHRPEWDCPYPNCVAHIEKGDFVKVDGSTAEIRIDKKVVNVKENGSIAILKTTETTTGTIGLSGARFVLLDANRQQYGSAAVSGDLSKLSPDQINDLEAKFADQGITGVRNGLLFFGNLPYGTYYLREASAPAGYVGDPHEYKIIIGSDETVTIYDTRASVAEDEYNADTWAERNDHMLIINNVKQEAPYISVKLLKMYDTDGAPEGDGYLEGATFVLEKQKPGAKDWEICARVKSDEKGMVYFQQIHVENDEQGTAYRIREIEAPAGYENSGVIINLGHVLTNDEKPENEGKIGIDINVYGDGTTGAFLRTDEILWAGSDDIEQAAGDAPSSAIVSNAVLYGEAQVRKTDSRTGTGLPGATLAIFYDEDGIYRVGSADKVLGNSDEKTGYVERDALLKKGFVSEVVTDARGYATFTGLPVGIYYVKEIASPPGYQKTGVVRPVVVREVTNNNQTTVQGPSGSSAPVITDQQISIQISKRGADGEELFGAVFNLIEYGDQGAERTIWTMNDGATKTIPYNLLSAGTGQIYILREMYAPKGYAYADDIRFTIDEDGTIKFTSATIPSGVYTEDGGKTLVVEDTPVTLTIRKRKDTTEGELLSGAHLGLYQVSSTGEENLVHDFYTDGTPYTIPAGILEIPPKQRIIGPTEIKYVLRELNAPKGYDRADEIGFTVKGTGTIELEKDSSGKLELISGATGWEITMVDIEQRSFYFQKVDDGPATKVLEGAIFTLYETDADGKPKDWEADPLVFKPEPWESGAVANRIETSTVPENGRTMLIKDHYYVLEEVEPPKGYLKPLTYAIRFQVIEEGGKLKMRLLNGSANNINAAGDTITMRDVAWKLSVSKVDDFGNQLAGATLQIFEYDKNLVNEDGTIGGVPKDAKPLCDQPIISRDGKIDIIAEHPELMQKIQLGSDHCYALVEVITPENYRRAEPIPFYIAASGVLIRLDGVTVDRDNTIVMEDKSKGVGIAKRDIADHNYLAGCTLEISSLDDDYFIVNPATWTSGEDEQTWTFDMDVFSQGYTYILSELEAPDGYAYTDPIYFTVGYDNQVYVDGVAQPGNIVYIEDGKIRLAVSKQDKYTGEEVAGALLGLYRLEEDGSETLMVDPWRTGTGPLSLNTSSMTTSGDAYVEYILRELEAPEGYYLADPIHFALNRDGNIFLVTQGEGGEKTYTPYSGTTLIMREEPKFNVRKMDTDGKYVTGATLQITAKDDASFEAITWTTENAPKIFDLDSGETPFKEGVTYVLKELKAPDGYKVAASIEFTIKSGKLYVNGEQVDNMRLVMLDYKVDTAGKDGPSNSGGSSSDPQSPEYGKAPKTGDDTPLAMLILLCITGFLGATSSFVKYLIWKRKHRVYD